MARRLFSFQFSALKPSALGTTWLVLAVLWAQALGQWHGVAHALHGPDNGAPLAWAAQGQNLPADAVTVGAESAAAPATWLDHLLGTHRDAGECRLYDQLSHGDAAPTVVMLALPAAVPLAHIALLNCLAVARRAVLFQARGPPAVR